MAEKRSSGWKKYVPRTELIPFIVVGGGLGAIVVMKAFPIFSAWLASKTPTIQKPAAG